MNAEKLRYLGSVHRKTMQACKLLLKKPGVSGNNLQKAVLKVIGAHGVRSAFHKFNGFPAHICVSVGQTVLHGIPNNDPIQDGELVRIDIGLIDDQGTIVDAARTFVSGKTPAPSLQRNLLLATQNTLKACAAVCKAGTPLTKVAAAGQEVINSCTFFVVEGYSGHFLKPWQLHVKPSIWFYTHKNISNKALEVGDCFAIEPILSTVETETTLAKNLWNINIQRPSILTAHFENTYFINDNGQCEQIT